MDYMTTRETALKWGLSERRIQEMCEQERIPGATRFGHGWAIPKNSERPQDKRIKTGKYIKH